jgi:hypothetical protein
VCLQKGGNGNNNNPYGTRACGAATTYGAGYAGNGYGGANGQNCDFYLGDAAKHCTQDWRWVWVDEPKWWVPDHYSFKWDCSDSSIYSVAVWAAIGGVAPNAAFCGV